MALVGRKWSTSGFLKRTANIMQVERNDENTPRKELKVTDLPKAYVKMKGAEDWNTHKILLPKTMPLLLSICQKSLQQADVKCLLNENGFVIDSVSEIQPGSIIQASTIDPEFEPHAPGSHSPRAALASTLEQKTEEKETKTEGKLETPKKEALTTPKKAPLSATKDSRIRTPTSAKDDKVGKASPILFRLSQLEKPAQSPSTTGRAKIDMRKVSRPPSSSESDGENEPPVDIRSVSTRFTAFMSNIKDSSSDEEDQEIKRRREERRKKIEMTKSCVVLDNPENLPFQQMLEEIVPPAEAPKTLEQALERLRKERVHFIQGCSDLEGEQLFLWIRGAADQPFLKRHPPQPYHDPVVEIASSFFVKHRFGRGKEAVFRFKGAIVGPRKSGKSTLLGTAVDQYLLELAVSGLWKSTFVFAVDMKVVAPLFGNCCEFYHTLLDHVLDACQKQHPLVRPYLKKIRKQMKSVTEMRSPLLGHHPYHEVDLLAKRLNEAWRDSNAFGPFITGVFMLPVLLPKALGYEYVSMFVDNLEYADVDIAPHGPFNTDGTGAFAVEHVKYALSQCNFIVGSETVQDVYGVLGAIDEEGVDLTAGLDIMTLYDTTDDLGSRTRYDYVLEVQEEPTPIRVTVDMCGGIVAYLTAWDELNHTLFQLERTNKNDDKYMELYYEAVTDAQNLVDLLFVCPGSEKITVSGVRRDRKWDEHFETAPEESTE